MIIPPLTILVGVYTFLTKIKALNTYWGMIVTLVAFGLPMAIFLYSNFIKSIPKELDEASIMDGAGILQTFYYVILPELKPITATIIILHGVAAWNEFAYSMYILQKPSMMTITLTIKKFFTGTTVDYGGACAAAVLAILPLTIVYLILQESFIQGQIDSAIKG
jgi:raffinose/stachyose/melibiose transport system permease protein